jgi:carboxypeptidase Taq
MTDAVSPYDELLYLSRRSALLSSCGAVLGWERETFMPDGGAELRAEQLSLLAGMTHEWSTAPRIGELLDELEGVSIGTLPAGAESCLREIRRNYRRATCLPRKLVESLSHTTALAQQRWVEARKAADYSLFAPWLEKIIDLKQQEAAAVGWPEGGCPYDALLDEYEPNTAATDVESVFRELREALVPLMAQIQNSAEQAPVDLLKRYYPRRQQEQLAKAAARAIGFDFDRGRLDVAAHPFCSGFGPGDCRLTTRYDEQFFSSAFFGTLHEAGHGLYEQGLSPEHFGTPLGTACSLAIHESQSRLWENLVGRSDAFWRHFFPMAQEHFPEALANVQRDDFVFAVNHSAPSLIRVEADEVTYNLHIMLRFDIERGLISGDLKVNDLPDAWNTRFEADFGIRPQDDASGCLQDVHWSAGLFGYFPTYTLGTIYASQFYEAFVAAEGTPNDLFAAGNFETLIAWLRQHVHQHGQRYSAAELVRRATGSSLNQRPLVRHLQQRFAALYQ